MNETGYPKQDEISVGSIRNAFLVFFSFFFRTVEFLLRSIWRYRILFLVFCIAGLLVGYLRTGVASKHYQLEMILVKNELPVETYFELIRNLNDQVSSGSSEALSEELNLSPEQLSQLISLEATRIENSEKEIVQQDGGNMITEPFKIVVAFREAALSQPLQDGLVDYLNKIPYLVKMKNSDKLFYEQKLAFINQQQASIDSIKQSSMRGFGGSTNRDFNPADLYEQSRLLEIEKGGVMKWLTSYQQGVQLIKGFTIPVTAVTGSKSGQMIRGLIAGLLVGAVICMMLSLYHLVKQNDQRTVSQQ